MFVDKFNHGIAVHFFKNCELWKKIKNKDFICKHEKSALFEKKITIYFCFFESLK